MQNIEFFDEADGKRQFGLNVSTLEIPVERRSTWQFGYCPACHARDVVTPTTEEHRNADMLGWRNRCKVPNGILCTECLQLFLFEICGTARNRETGELLSCDISIKLRQQRMMDNMKKLIKPPPPQPPKLLRNNGSYKPRRHRG